ncbi:MAG: hypothetical protein KJO12_05880 [Ignavibacteria bacterium]|nr:hypothetical protein [Ignavibacteria bacterium]
MKKTFLLLIIVGITFLSCSDNLDNTIVISPTEADKLINPNPSIYQHLFASKLIDGEIGGELVLDETFINGEGREINVYARLRVLERSYKGTINISMLANDEDVSIQLFPEMNFNRAVRLDLIYTGIDLKALGYTTTGNVDFAYFADNGDVELIESDFSHVNIQQNQISVRNAKLLHFSRYGFIR